MDIRRLQAEITVAEARIENLNNDLASARQWLADLTTSLAVLRKLGGIELQPVAMPVAPPSLGRSSVIGIEVRKKGIRRSDVVERAGEALVELLTERGHHMRPMEAVTLLRERYRLVVGSGISGRETSDLSAALGNGKFPPLYVTRSEGWGLKTWHRDAATEVAASEDEKPDWDLELDSHREADAEREENTEQEDADRPSA